MTRTFQACAAAVALSLTVGGFASAADRSAPEALSDEQLDRVAGGSASVADGDSSASGGSAQTDATLESQVRADGPSAGDTVYGSAVGQVTASAAASLGAHATATSSLSLSVTLP